MGYDMEEAKADVKTYRVAVSGDKAGILKVFAEVAPEVPTAVRPQTEGYIEGWVATGKSWVAVDADNNIVGYALAEGDGKMLSLVYLGVSKTARDQHVCSSLVSKLKAGGAPIVTDVRSNNKSSMVERFKRFGFVQTDVDENRTKLRWEKPKENPPARVASI